MRSLPSPVTKSLSSKAGFTITELLFVIAVIAVLAAILFPIIGNIRERALLSQCAGNLRNISAALFLHIAENDGYLPHAAQPDHPDGTRNFTRWTRDPAMTIYLPLEARSPTGGNWENSIYVCPAVVNDLGQSGPENLRVTYCATQAMWGPNAAGDQGRIRTERRLYSTIVNPSGTVLVYEGRIVITNVNTNYSQPWSNVRTDIGRPPAQTQWMDFAHNGRMNVMMADGAIRIFTPENFALMDELLWRGVR